MRRQLHVSWQCSVVRRLLQTWHQTSNCVCSVSDVLTKKYLERPTTVTVYQVAHLSDTGCLRLSICIRDMDTTRCWYTRGFPHEVSMADYPHSLAGSRSQRRGRSAYRPTPSDGEHQETTWSHLWARGERMSPNIPAHQALRLQVEASVGRRPDRDWVRSSGRPRNRCIDQLRQDHQRPPADLWRVAIQRGHTGATLRSSTTTWWRRRRRRRRIFLWQITQDLTANFRY